jgi:hypothetical protein
MSYSLLRTNRRSIHEVFQAKMAEEAYEYCAYVLALYFSR